MVKTHKPDTAFTVRERIFFVRCLGYIFHIEPALALAFFDKETGGEPWCKENGGRMKLGFEQGPFNRTKRWHKVFTDQYGDFPKVEGCTGVYWRCKDQHKEYEHVEKASLIHREHALNATGGGIVSTQMWEAGRMGYGNSLRMYERYQASEAEQILGFFLFLQFADGGRGRYPLFGPQRASATFVGSHLETARRSQRQGDLYPIALRYRGNQDKARYYADRLTEFYTKWLNTLSSNIEHGADGKVGYGWSVDDDTPPLLDLRGVNADDLWQTCRGHKTMVGGASRWLELYGEGW